MSGRAKETFSDASTALSATLKSSYKLAPAAVVVAACLAIVITLIAIKSVALMVGIIVILVVVTSLAIYANTQSYGQAALGLVAGLLMAFAVDWKPATFMAFVAAWVGFSLLVFMVSSIRLAAKCESIYRQAALRRDSAGYVEVEKKLRDASDSATLRLLGPLDRAESVLLLTFRGFPIESIQYGLQFVEQLTAITNIDHKRIAQFLGEYYRTIGSFPRQPQDADLELMFGLMQEAPILPDEFISVFMKSHHLVVSGRMNKEKYMRKFEEAVMKGLSPEEAYEYIGRGYKW